MSPSDSSLTDLDLAGRKQAALQRLIEEHAGGLDPRRLRRALSLCRELSDALDDDYCRRKVLLIEEFAAELFSTAEPRARGNLPGADFLRNRIREALEPVQSRVYSLERARRFGQPALARAFSARFAG